MAKDRSVRLRRRIFTGTLLLLSVQVLWAWGCTSRDSTQGEPATAGIVVVRRATEGPVSVTLTASAEELDVTERLSVVMDITAEQGVTVNPRVYETVLSESDARFDFRLIRCGKEEAMPTQDGRLRWSYTCELEFFVSGEYELPGAEVSFVDTRGLRGSDSDEAIYVGSPATQYISTESISVVVSHAQGEELTDDELTRIKTLAPIDLPYNWGPWPWLGPLAAIACIFLALTLLRRRRARKAIPPPPIPADVWARREIAALIAEDLVAKGFVQKFHYRISDIVRGYVERRFTISAPEMTSEEFLANAAADDRFGSKNNAELVNFLYACDMVKYAGQVPQPNEADTLVHAAGVFVERTRSRLTTPDVATSQGTRVEERVA